MSDLDMCMFPSPMLPYPSLISIPFSLSLSSFLSFYVCLFLSSFCFINSIPLLLWVSFRHSRHIESYIIIIISKRQVSITHIQELFFMCMWVINCTHLFWQDFRFSWYSTWNGINCLIRIQTKQRERKRERKMEQTSDHEPNRIA